jgi:hypothetical protein
MSNTSNSDGKNYIDLLTEGTGYLNRFRVVPVKRGDDYISVDIAALHGPTEDIEYTYFDARVTGKKAIKLVKKLKPSIDQKKKVLVRFIHGDLTPTPFVYKKGPKEGETGFSLNVHLLTIRWIKIDGVIVYTEFNGYLNNQQNQADKQERAAA